MDEVEALLKRKREIDELKVGQFVETQRWLVAAVELLLRAQKGAPNENRNLKRTR
jgi:hypothetical protein